MKVNEGMSLNGIIISKTEMKMKVVPI